MNKKVIIVGGGIAGLATSLFLKKAGIKSEIYEQAPAFSKKGGSFVVHPNGMKVLKELNLGEELKSNSHQITDFKFMNSEGVPLFDESDLGEFSDLGNEFELINISRYHLIRVLHEKAAKEGIEIKFGKKIMSIEQCPSHVTAFFEDGTQTTGDILIGADGVNSRTRSILFPNQLLNYAGKWAIWGVLSPERLKENRHYFDREASTIFLHDNFNFFVSKHHQTDEDRLSWTMIVNEKRKLPKKHFEALPVEQLKKEVAARFSNWAMPIGELILNTETFIPKQLYSVEPMSRFSAGRVALIGDALHTTDPNTGFGTTLGLEDAMYLSKMLRDHLDHEDAFYYYEYDRKDRAHSIHKGVKEMESLTDFSFLNDINPEELEKFFGLDYHIDWEQTEDSKKTEPV